MDSPRSTVGTVKVNGVRLGYRESGDPAGVPALLLHGSGSSARTWDRFTVRLTARGYRAIAVDLRGHATSARTGDYSLTSIRDDVLDLLETLALRDAVVIGHSVGGYAALAKTQACTRPGCDDAPATAVATEIARIEPACRNIWRSGHRGHVRRRELERGVHRGRAGRAQAKPRTPPP